MSKNRNARKGNQSVSTITPQALVQQVMPAQTSTSQVTVVKETAVSVVDPDPTVDTTKPAGTRVLKLANSKASVVSPVSRAKPTSQTVETVKNHLQQYIEYAGRPANQQDVQTKIGFIRILMTYCYQHQEDAVLDAVYAAFRKYRTTLLSPEVALQGIQKIPSPHQERIQQIYTLFWHISASTSKSRMLDLAYAGQKLGNGNLISYMERHMK